MRNTKDIKTDGLNTKSNREESLIQASSVEWFRNNYCLKHHSPRYDIFSVPNEATYRNNNFKALGVRKGASDIVVVLNNKVLFIEIKDPLGGQSDYQIDFQKVVESNNHNYYVVRSLLEFQGIIKLNL